MIRTQVYLRKGVAHRIKIAAHCAGTSQAEVIGAAIEEGIEELPKATTGSAEGLLALVELGKRLGVKGPKDLPPGSIACCMRNETGSAVIVDSSALVSLISNTDANHRLATATAERLLAEQRVVITPADVFTETVNVLGKRFGHGFTDAAHGWVVGARGFITHYHLVPVWGYPEEEEE
jgi:hypothetical protein